MPLSSAKYYLCVEITKRCSNFILRLVTGQSLENFETSLSYFWQPELCNGGNVEAGLL
jgi:hypothetical protein